MTKREKQQEAEVEIEKLRLQGLIERAKTLATVEADYDLEVLRQSQYTYMDEALILATMVVLGSAFVPEYASSTLEAFGILEKMPEWFQWAVIGIYIRVIGIRFLAPNFKLPFSSNKSKKDK